MCHRWFGSTNPLSGSQGEGCVSVCVEDLAALSVLRFELVIVKIVHQML